MVTYTVNISLFSLNIASPFYKKRNNQFHYQPIEKNAPIKIYNSYESTKKTS